MTTKSIENNQPLAVCLHTSASSGRQWQELAASLEERIRTITPDLVGYGKGNRYRRGSRFHFDEEVLNVLRQIKAETGKDNGPLHLILGSETHTTARKVTEVLNDVLPNVELVTVDGAEHMAPATQADKINPLFAGHVVATMERQYSIAA